MQGNQSPTTGLIRNGDDTSAAPPGSSTLQRPRVVPRVGFGLPGRTRRDEPEEQVKLLRFIEAREFTPAGDTQPRRFAGKLIAATNRDLPTAISEGKFREDLYYRLCPDLIETPSLAQQLEESPGVVEELVEAMSGENGGDDAFARYASTWIGAHLSGYAWPGNYGYGSSGLGNAIAQCPQTRYSTTTVSSSMPE